MSIHADLLDLGVLHELRDMLGDRLNTILSAFGVQATASAAQIEEQLRAGDLAGVRASAHKLRSAAGSVGAKRLASQAAALEQSALHGDTKATDQEAGLLVAITVATITALGEQESPPAVP